MLHNDFLCCVFILSMILTCASSTAPGTVMINIGIPDVIESISSEEFQCNLEFCIGSGRSSDEQCSWLPNQKVSSQYVQGQTFSIQRSFDVDDIRSTFYFNGNFSFQATNRPLKTLRFKDKLFQYTSHDGTQVASLYSNNFELLPIGISVKCKEGYFPPYQCSQFCFPIAAINDCDINGNKICLPGYSLLISLGECIKDMCKTDAGFCKNNSTCENGLSSIKCICQPNFSGSACELWKPCENHRCQNSGTCVPTRPPLDYVCQCKENYYGTYCEQYDDPCKQKLCPTDKVCQWKDYKVTCLDAPRFESTKTRQSLTTTSIGSNKAIIIAQDGGQTGQKETVGFKQYPVQRDFTTIGIIIILLFSMVCCFTIIFWIQMNKYFQKRKKYNHYSDTIQTSSIIPMLSHEIYVDNLKRWRSMDDGFTNTWSHKTCSQFSVISFKSGFNTCERPEKINYSNWPTTIKARVSMRKEDTEMENKIADGDKIDEFKPVIDNNDLPIPEESFV